MDMPVITSRLTGVADGATDPESDPARDGSPRFRSFDGGPWWLIRSRRGGCARPVGFTQITITSLCPSRCCGAG